MQEDKIIFLQEEMFSLIDQLPEKAKPGWGIMNCHEMIEHLTDFFNVSVEKIIFTLMIPAEQLPKYREFLYSDKAFRENTKAPAAVLGDIPLPLRAASFTEAKNTLKDTVAYFFDYFALQPGKASMHPIFGMLNFEEWVMLHYKHVQHHLRQFAVLA
jgi:Protein of unknown function (DUF1569)